MHARREHEFHIYNRIIFITKLIWEKEVIEIEKGVLFHYKKVGDFFKGKICY